MLNLKSVLSLLGLGGLLFLAFPMFRALVVLSVSVHGLVHALVLRHPATDPEPRSRAPGPSGDSDEAT